MTAYIINFNPVIEMTDEQFYQLCRANPEVKFERNAQGERSHYAAINATISVDASNCPIFEY